MLTAARGVASRGHQVSLAAPADSAILQRARSAGLTVLAVGFVRDFDPVSLLRLLRHCHGRQVDVVCMNMDRVVRLCGLAARLAGVPVRLPRRGSEFPLKDKWVYRFNYRDLTTGFIVNSQATAGTLTRHIHWRPAGRVHVLYNGLDTRRFELDHSVGELRQRLNIDAAASVLVVLGELTSRKNASLLLSVAPRLRSRFPKLRILLVGTGEAEAELRSQIDSLELKDCVQLLGFRDDVPEILAAADLLVHPAKVEGFGFAVAEGMAAGLPVVATRASSIPEIVDDGRTGALFAPNDPEALHDAVLRYLEDPSLRKAHGQAGRNRIRSRFELSDRTAELESLFLEELHLARA